MWSAALFNTSLVCIARLPFVASPRMPPYGCGAHLLSGVGRVAGAQGQRLQPQGHQVPAPLDRHGDDGSGTGLAGCPPAGRGGHLPTHRTTGLPRVEAKVDLTQPTARISP